MSKTAASMQLRIDAEKVSTLMDIVGELGLAVNAVVNNDELTGVALENFHVASHRLNLLVQEIQSSAANLSMVPVGSLCTKMRKLVRDLNKQTKKSIELELRGQDVEIDKSVLDSLQDPLIHIIRNSADHGIESDTERQQAGKPLGKIIIDAMPQGSEIHIMISDNGRGLNREAILNKARERGLPHVSDKLSDSQVWRYILHPGFSTAAAVTNLSGRGVGMDVVNSTIEKLRGRFNIESRIGEGTTVTMQIPLSLAFLDCFIVRLHDYLYAIPIDMVVEVLQPDEENVIVASENNSETIPVRGNLVPIRRLEKFYNYKIKSNKSIGEQVIVIVKSSYNDYCIPVDEILGQQQVTMKPATGLIADVKANAGCAILNTGEIAIALDCEKIAES
jgi:two-component system, chemotaxis family, sensor kinase CheA